MNLALRFILIFLTFSPLALAKEISVKGRSYIWTCGSKTVQSDLKFTYQPKRPEEIKEIQIIFGWQTYLNRYGEEILRDWQKVENQTLEKLRHDTWNWTPTLQLKSEDSETLSIRLQFVLKVIHWDGGVQYEKGSESPLGYFEIPTRASTQTCANSETDRPRFISYPLFKVIKF